MTPHLEPVAMTSLAAALMLAIVIFVRSRAVGTNFVQRLSNVIAFGTLKLTQRLAGELER